AFPDQSPLPAALHRTGTVVLDMVYEPLETRFLREAQQAGCTIIDGLEMLLAQAVAQFETWTGLEAPLDVMKSAALFLAQEQAASAPPPAIPARSCFRPSDPRAMPRCGGAHTRASRSEPC